MDAIDSGKITNAESGGCDQQQCMHMRLREQEKVIRSGMCIARKTLCGQRSIHKALLSKLQENKVDLVVLAGFLLRFRR